MKGAVLHKLGLNLVKRRVMRASYGFVGEPVFDPIEHEAQYRFSDPVDGNIRCKGVMKWCARRVPSYTSASVSFLSLRARRSKMTEWLAKIS
jgi:hypothetical protein